MLLSVSLKTSRYHGLYESNVWLPESLKGLRFAGGNALYQLVKINAFSVWLCL